MLSHLINNKIVTNISFGELIQLLKKLVYPKTGS